MLSQKEPYCDMAKFNLGVAAHLTYLRQSI